MTALRRLLPLAGLTAATLVLACAGIASAHVEPDVSAIPAGKAATVAFNVEHGCKDQPTTKIEIQVPASITDAKPVQRTGWQASTAGRVVTFEGGSQPPHEPTSFSITFTAPDTDGAELKFPVIQTCEKIHTDWIDPAETDEHPVPVVAIGPAGSPPSTPAPDDDEHEMMTTTTVGTSGPAAETKSGSDDGDSNAPIVIGAVVVILVIGGVVLIVRSRGTSGE